MDAILHFLDFLIPCVAIGVANVLPLTQCFYFS